MVLVNMSPREKRADAKKMQDSEVPEAKENKGPFFPGKVPDEQDSTAQLTSSLLPASIASQEPF